MSDTTVENHGAKRTGPVVEPQPNSAVEGVHAEQKKSFVAVNQLKDHFKSGAIPLQSDFAALIDIAEVGLRATGQAVDQSGVGIGMRLSASGKLELNTKNLVEKSSEDYVQLTVNTATNEAVLDLYQGLMHKSGQGLGVRVGDSLKLDNNRLCVGSGNGIAAEGTQVGVKIKPEQGIEVDDSGLKIKSGPGTDIARSLIVRTSPGIGCDKNGVSVCIKQEGLYVDDNNAVTVKAGDGLNLSEVGLTVFHGAGITINQEAVDVKAGQGINGDDDEISVQLGHGLKIDNGKVQFNVDSYAFGADKGYVSVRLDKESHQLVVPVDVLSGISYIPLEGLGIFISEYSQLGYQDDDKICVRVEQSIPQYAVSLYRKDEQPEGWECIGPYGDDLYLYQKL